MPMNNRTLRPRRKAAGGDPYWSQVSLLLHMDGAFTDSSANNLSVTPNGNAQISAAQSKFGGSSLSGGIVAVGDLPALQFEDGDWTIEAWVRPSQASTYQTVFSQGIANTANTGMEIALTGSDHVRVFLGNFPSIGFVDFAFAIPSTYENLWSHLAVSRQGSTVRVFWNGVQIGSFAFAVAITSFGVPTQIGGRFVNNQTILDSVFSGYIDELRVTKGVGGARYTANFTPPTAAFPNG